MEKQLQSIITEVERYKNEGHKKVKLDKLLSYLYCVSEEQTEMPSQIHNLSEITKLEYQGKLIEYRGKIDSRLELFKAVIEFSTSSIKSLFWLNGGAAIAILAFLGNILSKHPQPQKLGLDGLINSLTSFSIGVALSVLCSAAAYISQCAFSEAPKSKWVNRLRVLAISFGVLSVVAFFIAIFFAYYAFKQEFVIKL